jgi:hypothetical protein
MQLGAEVRRIRTAEGLAAEPGESEGTHAGD